MSIRAIKKGCRVLVSIEVNQKTKKAYILSDFTEPSESEHPDAYDAIESVVPLLSRMVGVALTGNDPSGAQVIENSERGLRNLNKAKK